MFQETVSKHTDRLVSLQEKLKPIRNAHFLAIANGEPSTEPPPVRTQDIGFARKALERRVAHKRGIPTRLKEFSRSEAEAMRRNHETGFDDPTNDYRWVRIGLRVKLVDDQFIPMTEEEAAEEYQAACADKLWREVQECIGRWKGLTLENILQDNRYKHPVNSILYKRTEDTSVNDLGRQHPKFWLDGGKLLTDLHFEAEQVETGKPEVRVNVVSNGEIVDTFTTTDVPCASYKQSAVQEAQASTKEGNNNRWGGTVYFREPTEAQFQAMLPTLDLDIGDGGPPSPSIVFVLNREQALQAGKHLKRVVSTDPDHPILHGILIDPRPDGFEFVATDTYRIMLCHVLGERRIQTISEDVTVPPQVLCLLEKLHGEEVTLEIGEQPNLPSKCKLVYRISDGEHSLTGHLTEPFGRFPNYSKIMPTKGELLEQQVVLGTKKDFLAALKSLGNVPRSESHRVLIEPGEGNIILQHDDYDGHVESDPIPDSSVPCTLAFNANYLRDYIDTLNPNDLLTAELAPTPPGPAAVSRWEDPWPPQLLFRTDYTYLQMTMRVD